MIEIKNKTVYIAGPISNVDWSDTKDNFINIHNRLNFLRVGRVFNPIYYAKPANNLSLDSKQKWQFYMRQSLTNLAECSTIVMMNGYHISKGARLEKYIAEELGLTVLKEKDLYETSSDI